MLGGVPDRLGLHQRVVLAAAGGLGGDRVDDLAVGEGIPVPAEVGGKVQWCFDRSRADDELLPGLVQLAQVLRREHPGVGDDHEVNDLVTLRERGHDR